MSAVTPALPMFDLSATTFATVSVTTRNSTYLVVVRPTFVVVVCPDGMTLRGTDVFVGPNGCLVLVDCGRMQLRTSTVRDVYVLEN